MSLNLNCTFYLHIQGKRFCSAAVYFVGMPEQPAPHERIRAAAGGNISVPSLEIAEKMAKVLSISLDELVYGSNKADNLLQDEQLLNLFAKTQELSENQKATVKDLLEAFILKTNLQKQLAQ